eukprot:Opistho-2@85527
MMKSVVFLLALVSVAFAAENTGRLVAVKTLLNEILVEGKDLTMVYHLFNVGSGPALEVSLEESGFPTEFFTPIAGLQTAHWERIAPNTNVTHSVIVRPIAAGYYNFTAARVSYRPNEDSEFVQTGLTSSLGQAAFMRSKDYDVKYAPHWVQWGYFAILAIFPVVVPFFLWYSSYAKYEAIGSQLTKTKRS